MLNYILVDDDPKTLKSVKRQIDSISKIYELNHLKSFVSSKKAFEQFAIYDFDLIIIDYEMPVYNGIELAKKIAKNKKIIFLTSTTNNERKIINNLDISGYLSKPFDIEEFKTILKNKIIEKTNISPVDKSNKIITIPIGRTKDVRFSSDKAYYISSSRNIDGEQPTKNCVHIYGKNDELLFKNIRESINYFDKILANFNFKKINQSTLINMAHVKERDNTDISLFDCKETFKVTSKEKNRFLNRLRDVFKPTLK